MWTRWSDLDRSFAALENFRQRMDRLFDDYNRALEGETSQMPSPSWSLGAGWPRTLVSDAGTALKIHAEIPGLSEKDIELNLNQNVLTLSGERKAVVPEGYSVHRQERGSYRFSRSFSLPCAIDPEKATATVKDGVLTVTLEKAPEARPRQITVKAS